MQTTHKFRGKGVLATARDGPWSGDHLRALSGFQIESTNGFEPGDELGPVGWTAYRSRGIFRQSISLLADRNYVDVADLDDDSPLDWSLEARVDVATERFDGAILFFSVAAGLGAAVATLLAITRRFEHIPSLGWVLSFFGLLVLWAIDSTAIGVVIGLITARCVRLVARIPVFGARKRTDELLTIIRQTSEFGVSAT